jgi:hypothetical protein
MAMLGSGVLAIWNGMKPGCEHDFIRWHIREHIPERVGLPGFLRGRRYVAVDGHPKFFNFYETQSTADLESPAYKDRLNNPTPWTLATVKDFTETSRTVCEVVSTQGIGCGPVVETIEFDIGNSKSDCAAALQSVLDHVRTLDGVIATHLLRGLVGQDQVMTEEKKLRGVPDKEVAWLIVLEACDVETIMKVRKSSLTNEVLERIGSTKIKRGIYRMDYMLAKIDLQ